MTRRLGSRTPTVERPRRKGWWGEPETDELEEEAGTAVAPAREPLRRAAPPAVRSVTPVGRSLTPDQLQAIRRIMRLFVDEDTANGIDPRCTLLCHRCAAPRRAIGSIRYERFTLCNDCATEYEVAHARGTVDTAGEFVERFAARAASA